MAETEGGARYIPVPEAPWDEVVPRLWQGGALRGVAADERFDVVLTLSEQAHRYLPSPEGVHDVLWSIQDAGLPDPEQVEMFALWVAEHHRLGSTVLVRCDAGLNRSGLIVARALVLLGHEPADAVAKVRAARGPDALCNEAFCDWLLERPAA